MEKFTLKFLLDYQCNCLWSGNAETEERLGYHIDDLAKIGLSQLAIKLNDEVRDLYWSRLNPIYQGFPSFWSAKMHLLFQEKVRQLYKLIIEETEDKFKIIISESAYEEINNEINSQKINDKLENFISNLVEYCLKHDISFLDKQELEDEVKTEYENWKIKERELLLQNND